MKKKFLFVFVVFSFLVFAFPVFAHNSQYDSFNAGGYIAIYSSDGVGRQPNQNKMRYVMRRSSSGIGYDEVTDYMFVFSYSVLNYCGLSSDFLTSDKVEKFSQLINDIDSGFSSAVYDIFGLLSYDHSNSNGNVYSIGFSPLALQVLNSSYSSFLSYYGVNYSDYPFLFLSVDLENDIWFLDSTSMAISMGKSYRVSLNGDGASVYLVPNITYLDFLEYTEQQGKSLMTAFRNLISSVDIPSFVSWLPSMFQNYYIVYFAIFISVCAALVGLKIVHG